jgi:hypothetical protein
MRNEMFGKLGAFHGTRACFPHFGQPTRTGRIVRRWSFPVVVNKVSTVRNLLVVYSTEKPGGEVVIDPVTAKVASSVVVEAYTAGVETVV